MPTLPVWKPWGTQVLLRVRQTSPNQVSIVPGSKWAWRETLRCLESLHTTSTRPVSLFHYFDSLREWANYEDSYIFINLFGPGVISRLDSSLKRIVQGFLPVAEVFLISFYGWDRVHTEFLTFSNRVVHHLKTEPSSLITRFGEYAGCSDLVL